MAFQQVQVDQFVGLLRGIYNDISIYDSRQYLTSQLQEVEITLDGPTKMALGLHILMLDSENPAVRAYGAVLVQHCVREKSIRVEDILLQDIYQWYSDELTSRLLRKAVLDLVVEVVMHSSTDVLLKILNMVFLSVSEKSEDVRIEKQMDTISCLIRTICDPTVRHARLPTLRALQDAIQAQLETILGLSLHFLESVFRKEQECSSLSSAGTRILESAAEVLGYLSPLASVEEWTKLSLVAALHSLLFWKPAQRIMIFTYKTLILSLSAANVSAAHRSIGEQLFKTVSEFCTFISSAGLEDLDAIEGILELTEEMKSAQLQQHLESVLTVSLAILSVPSLCFASRICSVLRMIEKSAMAKVPFYPFCDAIFLFTQKNVFHPANGSHELGRVISREQLSTSEMHSSCFGDFRGAARILLNTISRLQPQLSNLYILDRIRKLPSPESAQNDPHTAYGSVTQQSKTFVVWEATSWMVMHLCISFELCDEQVATAFSELISRSTSDAVLRPCFLDLMASFWNEKVGERSVEGLWEKSIDMLLSDLENSSSSSPDIDVLSARRRVATLLNRASTFSRFFPSLLSRIVPRLQAELVRCEGRERNILYEATSTFASVLTDGEKGAESSLGVVHPLIQEVQRLVFSVASDQAAFDALLTAGTGQTLGTIQSLTDAFGTLTSHFKTNEPTAFHFDMALRISPLVKCVLDRIHGIRPETYPPPYNSLLSLRDNEVVILLQPQEKKSFVPTLMKDKLHSAFGALRFGVYQLLGLLSRCLSTSDLLSICSGFNEWIPHGPINCMKTLLNQTLIPFIETKDDLFEPVLSFLMQYWESNPSVPLQQAHLKPEQKELIKEKLLWSLVKTIETRIVARDFLENGRWKSASSNTISMVCDLLLSLGKVMDTNFSFNLLKRFLELSAADVDASALHAIHCSAFQRICQMIFCTPDNVLPEKSLYFFCTVAGEFMVAHFDNACSILSQLGVDKDAVGSLYGGLLLSRNNQVKVRKCKDFLLEKRSNFQPCHPDQVGGMVA